MTQEQRDRYMSLAFESVMAIHRLPMPTIAAISGTGLESPSATTGPLTPVVPTQHSSLLPPLSVLMVAGACFGWGLELALGCDLRVASLDATICLPETSLGIFPGAGGCVLLRNVVGPSVAKDLIYTARRIQGQEAKGAQHSQRGR